MVGNEVFLTLFASCLLLHIKTTSQLPTQHHPTMSFVRANNGHASDMRWSLPEILQTLPTTAVAEDAVLVDFNKNMNAQRQNISKSIESLKGNRNSFKEGVNIGIDSHPNIFRPVPLRKKTSSTIHELGIKSSQKSQRRNRRASFFIAKGGYNPMSSNLSLRRKLLPKLLTSLHFAMPSVKSPQIIKPNKSQSVYRAQSLKRQYLDKGNSSNFPISITDLSSSSHFTKEENDTAQIPKLGSSTRAPLGENNSPMFAAWTQPIEETPSYIPFLVRRPGGASTTRAKRDTGPPGGASTTRAKRDTGPPGGASTTRAKRDTGPPGGASTTRAKRDTGLISPYCGPRRRRCFRWVPENECRNMCANNRRYEVCKFRRNGRLRCAWIPLDH